MVMSYRTTSVAKGWEALGETTILTTFKQHIGGAMEKKDPPRWDNGAAGTKERHCSDPAALKLAGSLV